MNARARHQATGTSGQQGILGQPMAIFLLFEGEGVARRYRNFLRRTNEQVRTRVLTGARTGLPSVPLGPQRPS